MAEPYTLMRANYANANAGYPTRAQFIPGTIVAYSKDGSPIRAAAVGSILGYTKDGYPVRAASVFDGVVCGGSTILFAAIGIAVGFLAADKFAEYFMSKR